MIKLRKMKKYLIISLLLIILCLSNAYSQWNVVFTPPGNGRSVMAMKFWDNNTGYHSATLYTGSTHNIYKTTNGGLNFDSLSSNYTSQRFMSVWILHPDTVLMCGDYGKIIRTVNGGANWSTVYVHSDTIVQLWGLGFTSSLTGYVAGSKGVILKTTNKGVNWFTQTSSVTSVLQAVWFLDENTGYVGGSHTLLKTTNAGVNWVNIGGQFASGGETITSMYFSDANTGVYGTNGSRIVRTTDGGTTYTESYRNVGTAVWSLSFVNANTGYGCTSAGKVLKTTNGGVDWGMQNTPLTENLYEIDFPSTNIGYVACWSGKILKTTNGGLTFTGKIDSEIPKNIKLEQNYPNPFNPQTTIKFSVPKTGFVSLKIFDIQGKEVKSLIAEKFEPGNYEIKLTSEGLSSGLYYYRLQTNGYSETRKMIILK